MNLRSFLIEFGDAERLPIVCAVTAFNQRDALALIRNLYRPDDALPEPVNVEPLSPEQIQERIGDFDFGVPVVRGIWYPHVDNP